MTLLFHKLGFDGPTFSMVLFHSPRDCSDPSTRMDVSSNVVTGSAGHNSIGVATVRVYSLPFRIANGLDVILHETIYIVWRKTYPLHILASFWICPKSIVQDE